MSEKKLSGNSSVIRNQLNVVSNAPLRTPNVVSHVNSTTSVILTIWTQLNSFVEFTPPKAAHHPKIRE